MVMAIDTEDDEDSETNPLDALHAAATDVIESIDEALGKIDDISTSDLRRRYTKRLDKAKDKLEVAKKALEELLELTDPK